VAYLREKGKAPSALISEDKRSPALPGLIILKIEGRLNLCEKALALF
jgi:hypothetical protein